MVSDWLRDSHAIQEKPVISKFEIFAENSEKKTLLESKTEIKKTSTAAWCCWGHYADAFQRCLNQRPRGFETDRFLTASLGTLDEERPKVN